MGKTHQQARSDAGQLPAGQELNNSFVQRVLVALLNCYQRFISPLLGPRCRFYPSCSSYAIQAIEKHGAIRGSGLACKRLCRCHPGNPGGIDEVPEVSTKYFPARSSNTTPDKTGARNAT